ncbi:MAG TPA: TolC family protein [Thermoanaerobaculia bacterium]|nr:TolC family protein [Thermoanaerobaculia bacterium]
MRSTEHMRRGGALFAAASLLGLFATAVVPAAAVAQTDPAPTAPQPGRQVDTRVARPTDVPGLEAQNGVLPLSLDQAITIAVRQNLGLVIERYTRQQSRLGITQSMGIYDLVSQASLEHADTQQAALDVFQANQSESDDVSFSFRQRLPTGGDVTVGYAAGRTETPEDPRRPGITESYTSGTTFSFVQPLLRDFGRIVNERNILVARYNDRISREEFERQVTLLTQQVVNAYLSLVEARQQLGVAQESMNLARELHERNRIQVDVGTLAPLELVQSEAAIATRDVDIINATSTVGDAADDLRQLLNLPPGPLWQAEIQPTTEPQVEPLTVNVEEAIATAYAERPEVRSQEIAVQRFELDSLFFRNQMRPNLDLNVRYGTGGFGLEFGDALDQITGLDFPTWSVSLDFAYPIQNRAARAASAIADIDVDRAKTQLEQQRTVVATEVRQAARALDTAVKQIEASRISREFQVKNLEAERKRYENGMSTSFQITQIQEELTRARSREVSSVITYRRALTEYYRATGRLLEVEGIGIDDPRTPEGPIDWWSFDRSLYPREE